MSWQNISIDPNSLEVINLRKKIISAARKAPVKNRVDYISQLAQGKRVLDVGVVDHVINNKHSPDWLHGAIASCAAYTLGVDILPEAIESLKKEGFNVRLQDITTEPLNEKFDLIVVGEVIEHLGNPSSLFESAKKMLLPGGRLILTTPNPYFLGRVRDNLLGGFNSDSVDHVTLLFPFGLAELCERAGLRLQCWRGIHVYPPENLTARIKIKLLGLLPISPESLCHAIIYECVPE